MSSGQQSPEAAASTEGTVEMQRIGSEFGSESSHSKTGAAKGARVDDDGSKPDWITSLPLVSCCRALKLDDDELVEQSAREVFDLLVAQPRRGSEADPESLALLAGAVDEERGAGATTPTQEQSPSESEAAPQLSKRALQDLFLDDRKRADSVFSSLQREEGNGESLITKEKFLELVDREVVKKKLSVFLSLRMSSDGKPAPNCADLESAWVRRRLTARGVDVLPLPVDKVTPRIDRLEDIMSSIARCDLFIIFGTKTYGEDTNNPMCSYHEFEKARNLGKIMVHLQMCDAPAMIEMKERLPAGGIPAGNIWSGYFWNTTSAAVKQFTPPNEAAADTFIKQLHDLANDHVEEDGYIDLRSANFVEDFSDRILATKYALDVQRCPCCHDGTFLLACLGIRPCIGPPHSVILADRRQARLEVDEAQDGGESRSLNDDFSCCSNWLSIFIVTAIFLVLFANLLWNICRTTFEVLRLSGVPFEKSHPVQWVWDLVRVTVIGLETLVLAAACIVSVGAFTLLCPRRTTRDLRIPTRYCDLNLNCCESYRIFGEWTDLIASLRGGARLKCCSCYLPLKQGLFGAANMNRVLITIVLLVCFLELVAVFTGIITWTFGSLWRHRFLIDLSFCTISRSDNGTHLTFDRSGCANGEVGTLAHAELLTLWSIIERSLRWMFPYSILGALVFAGPVGWSIFIVVTTAAISLEDHTRKEGERMVKALRSLGNEARRLSGIARSPALSGGMEQQKLQTYTTEFHRLEKSCRLEAYHLSALNKFLPDCSYSCFPPLTRI